MSTSIPRDTFLGKLNFYEVYDDFMGPKCFTLKNQFGQIYLVYWNGDFEGYSEWLYILISEERIDAVTRQELSLREAFKYPESSQLIIVKTFDCESKKYQIDIQLEFDDDLLPPKNIYINPETIKPYMPESAWGFKLKIAKKNKKHEAPERTVVTKIMDSFSELIESLMDNLINDKSIPRLYPLSASFGSFEVSLKTSHKEHAAIAMEQLSALLDDPKEIESKLHELNLDPYRLQQLLESVRDNNVVLKLTPKTTSYLKKPFELGKLGTSDLIERLNTSTVSFIDSYKVPQANNLERLIDIITRKVKGEYLTYTNVEGLNSKRQLQYYLKAAVCMGLLNENNTVASTGRFLASIESREGQYQFLADRFESAEFGWAWMKWAGVKTIRELEPESAALFVKDSVKGLNDNTSFRRSSCLSTWLKILQKHSREYSAINLDK
ncbi:DUF6575 domain-containing protein [Pseudoalteromonas sp. NZS100]|uniref:DUF6575 domain-containing protein n=1 Tax=Pseudoalteromonas sp. NZS100 TaxID=2792046 RepID=UPI0018CDE8D3|nr:DUF6575 domain-containing protein [Pseudoalteromonas sp. NZS100]MBH0068181.1 hypothetical protein [Pseudoalteromonas sp. NZS100]